MKLRSTLGFLSVIALSLSACHSSEIADSRDAAPEAIYTAFSLEWTEGNPNVECLASFRMGGAMGTTLVLSKPSQVALDGEVLKVDSSRIRGAFYPADKPGASFAGQHKWEYTDITGKKYVNEFSFQPFSLTNPIPATIGRGDLVLPFAGVEDGDMITINIKDTSSSTIDILRQLAVKNGKIVVAASEMAGLSNGPITFNINCDLENSLKETTREGGHMRQLHRLKPIETVMKARGF